jgi:hypothetical protein
MRQSNFDITFYFQISKNVSEKPFKEEFTIYIEQFLIKIYQKQTALNNF